MTGQERYLAALRHELPDCLPVNSLGIENLEAIAAKWGVTAMEVCERLGLDGYTLDAEYTGPEHRAPDGPKRR